MNSEYMNYLTTKAYELQYPMFLHFQIYKFRLTNIWNYSKLCVMALFFLKNC